MTDPEIGLSGARDRQRSVARWLDDRRGDCATAGGNDPRNRPTVRLDGCAQPEPPSMSSSAGAYGDQTTPGCAEIISLRLTMSNAVWILRMAFLRAFSYHRYGCVADTASDTARCCPLRRRRSAGLVRSVRQCPRSG